MRFHRAKLDIKVSLSKNKFPIKIDDSKKIRFVLKITDQDNSFYTQNIENVELTEFGTYTIDFKVSPSIKDIRVTTYCTYFSIKDNRETTLETSSTKAVNAGRTDSFINLYLRENNDGFYLDVLGKNGEPKVRKKK